MNLLKLLYTLFLLLVSNVEFSFQQNCDINVTSNLETNPLFLSEQDEILRITRSGRNAIIAVAVNQRLRIVCTGTRNFFKILGTGNNILDLTCDSNGKYRTAAGVSYDIKDLTCNTIPDSILRNITNNNLCATGDSAHEVGFLLPAPLNVFLTQYKICRTDVIRRSRHSNFIMRGDVATTDTKRFDFRGSDDKLYSNNILQLRAIKNLQPRYVFDSVNNYFARGHLIANAYFPFAAQNRATFFYHNAAPQWQKFNAGNWLQVETRMRIVAQGAQVYVGVFGQLQFTKIDNTKIDVYLDMLNKILPVPEYFWNYVIRPDKSTIFIAGINDIFLTEAEYLEKSKTFCKTTPCTAFGWTGSAQIFCCEVNKELLTKVGIVA